MCCIGDISIPPSWHTIEYYSNTLYIVAAQIAEGFPILYATTALRNPCGNYAGASLALRSFTRINFFGKPTFGFIYK